MVVVERPLPLSGEKVVAESAVTPALGPIDQGRDESHFSHPKQRFSRYAQVLALDPVLQEEIGYIAVTSIDGHSLHHNLTRACGASAILGLQLLAQDYPQFMDATLISEAIDSITNWSNYGSELIGRRREQFKLNMQSSAGEQRTHPFLASVQIDFSQESFDAKEPQKPDATGIVDFTPDSLVLQKAFELVQTLERVSQQVLSALQLSSPSVQSSELFHSTERAWAQVHSLAKMQHDFIAPDALPHTGLDLNKFLSQVTATIEPLMAARINRHAPTFDDWSVRDVLVDSGKPLALEVAVKIEKPKDQLPILDVDEKLVMRCLIEWAKNAVDAALERDLQRNLELSLRAYPVDHGIILVLRDNVVGGVPQFLLQPDSRFGDRKLLFSVEGTSRSDLNKESIGGTGLSELWHYFRGAVDVRSSNAGSDFLIWIPKKTDDGISITV